MRLVPLVVGRLGAAGVAEVIEAVWGGPETAIVISSDLSHYLPYTQAVQRDRATITQILALDATIYPSLHWHWIGPLMAIIVVGGLGSIPGAAIAAMVLGISQTLLQIPLGTTWAQTVFYAVLFITLVFRPNGFFGGRLAKRF